MPVHVLALVLAAAAIHAVWNLFAKQIGGSARSGPLMWTLTAISSVAYAPVGLWILWHTGWRPDAAALGWIIGSGVIHVGYFLLLLRGYRASDLSLVYPVARGTGPLLSSLGAIMLMGEHATALSVTGTGLIVLGVLVLTARPELARTPHLRAGLAFGLAVGVSIAVYTLWDGWAVQRAHLPPLVFYWGGELTRVTLFTPAALADKDGVRALWARHRWRVLGIALLSPLSYMLILVAMRTGPIGHIAPARELSILIGAWLGGRVLGEGERRRRLVAAAAFAAGVIALAIG